MLLLQTQHVSNFGSVTVLLLCVYYALIFLCSSVAAIGFAQTEYTVLESVGIQTVCVELTSPIPVDFDRNVPLILNTADDTATGE